jgi:hypothetical protein
VTFSITGVVTAADGAGLAGGMLTIEVAGVGASEASAVAAGAPDDVAVGIGDVAATEASGVGEADTAGRAVAGCRVGVERGRGEPVGTGVAAGGVAPTPVTAGVGESTPGFGIGDEEGGVGVTPASRGTVNE